MISRRWAGLPGAFAFGAPVLPDMPPRFDPLKSVRPMIKRTAVEAYDDRRGSAYSRGYDHVWQRSSKAYLREHPLCVCCKANGVVTAATLVDHIVPHRGDKALFRDPRNRQALCGRCHNVIKKAIERMWERGSVGLDALRLDRLMPDYFDQR